MSDDDLVGGMLVTGVAGLLFGFLGGLGLKSCSGPYDSYDSDRVEIFREEEKPAVMRVYRAESKDWIFVESPLNEEKYTPLRKHLESFGDNIADRELEAARIKKQVRWYEE